ncbi:DMT family transporter [uncultured Desulfobacter sp.]|uniref:DMT family transporter n=1 Tax=uncultured Desulfobacter sp. TaxID=240139 RepID=UPI002AABE261|nr:DMT family transporter [uncultured Desulfobacter sp.]
MKPIKHITVAYPCLVAAMVLWASTFAAQKLALRTCHPTHIIFARMFIASLCAIPFSFSFSFVFKNRPKIRQKDIKFLVMLVLCEPCLYFFFETRALVYTSASQAGMLTTMVPLFTALGAWIFLQERLDTRTFTGFFVATGGALWLSLASPPDPHGPNPLLGNTFELIAMLCAGGYTISLKKLAGRYNPMFLAFIQAFAGTAFYLPFMLIQDTGPLVPQDPVALWAIIYLGVVITIGAYAFYNFGVSRIPASQATAFINLIPVLTLVMNAIVLEEHFSTVQYMASTLVLAGVIMTQEIPFQRAGKATGMPLPPA